MDIRPARKLFVILEAAVLRTNFGVITHKHKINHSTQEKVLLCLFSMLSQP